MILTVWPWVLTFAVFYIAGVFTGMAVAWYLSDGFSAPESPIPQPTSHIRTVNRPPYNWKDEEV